MMLKDMPGGQQFIDACLAAISDVALAFVGEPDDRVLASLEEMKENLACGWAENLGPDVAAKIADAFVGTIRGEKHRLEASGRAGRA
jgi:hypothetical protein